MPRQRDLLRALVTLMKTLAAAYGITISATNVRPEVVQPPKSMPQTLKLKGPAPQFHKEISPLSVRKRTLSKAPKSTRMEGVERMVCKHAVN